MSLMSGGDYTLANSCSETWHCRDASGQLVYIGVRGSLGANLARRGVTSVPTAVCRVPFSLTPLPPWVDSPGPSSRESPSHLSRSSHRRL